MREPKRSISKFSDIEISIVFDVVYHYKCTILKLNKITLRKLLITGIRNYIKRDTYIYTISCNKNDLK